MTETKEVNVNYYDDEEIEKKDNTQLLSQMTIAFAEYIGTGLLVFVSCMGCTFSMSKEPQPAIQTSLIGGLAVMTAIQIFGHISGAHVNPAISVCALIMEQISLKQALVYILSQIAGSFTGYAILMSLTPHKELENAANHCVTLPHSNLSDIQAIFTEVMITLVLALAICAVWDSKNAKNTDSAGLRIGLIVAVLGMAAGPYTGASMNPARSVGPAIWNYNLESHYVYWVGPILGSAIAGVLYKTLFLQEKLSYHDEVA